MCTVMNLSTGLKQNYTCTPKESVIAAFAQSNHDWNTWDYSKYEYLLGTGLYTVTCGDFSAFLDGRDW